MSGFADMNNALRMRQVLTGIAEEAVNRLRPEEKIGTVFSIDLSRQIARVLLPGHTANQLIDVRFARDKVPTREMAKTFNTDGYEATGDIVRIAGRPGSFYISDFVDGIPAIDPSAREIVNANIGIVDGELVELNNALVENALILEQAQLELDELNNVTLPALQTDLEQNQLAIDDLNNTVIPALNVRLSDAETTLQNLDVDTISQALADMQDTVDALNGKFPITETDISDGAITTPKMTANSIDGDRIAANTLHADKIVANSITGDQIAANAITAGKIAITDLTDLIRDPNFGEDWIIEAPNEIVDDTVTTLPNGMSEGTVVRLLGAGVNSIEVHQENMVPAAFGQEFYGKVWVRKVGTSGVGSVILRLRWLLPDGTSAVPHFVEASMPLTSMANGAWYLLEVSGVVPTGRAGLRMDILHAGNVPAGTNIEFYQPSLRRKATGELLVDGIIKTHHMIAGSISGDRIETETLHANRIIAGSITTDRMTANSINGDRITGNTLHAGKIVAGSITTDRMTANTINGDRITTNTLHADRIIGNTITGDKIAANAIQARHILIGDMTNLIPSPLEWTGPAINGQNTDTLGDFAILRGNGTSNTHATGGSFIPVQPGDQLHFSWRGYANYSGFSGSTYAYFMMYNGQGGYVTAASGAGIPQGTTGYAYAELHITIPAGVYKILFHPYASPNAQAAVRQVELRRKNTGKLIVDGSITADQLSADAIDGKTITGAVFQTAASGNRIILAPFMVGTHPGMYFLASGETYVFSPRMQRGGDGITISSYTGATPFSFFQINRSKIELNLTASGGAATSYIFDTAFARIGGGLEIAGPIYAVPFTAAGSANMTWTSSNQIAKISSSKRFKTDIFDLDDDVETLLKLRPVRFRGTNKADDPKEVHAGFISEEAELLGLKKWVEYDADGRTPGSFKYANWTAAQQKILRYHQDEIKSLKERIALLESRSN